jgi:hypothetical protein
MIKLAIESKMLGSKINVGIVELLSLHNWVEYCWICLAFWVYEDLDTIMLGLLSLFECIKNWVE